MAEFAHSVFEAAPVFCIATMVVLLAVIASRRERGRQAAFRAFAEQHGLDYDSRGLPIDLPTMYASWWHWQSGTRSAVFGRYKGAEVCSCEVSYGLRRTKQWITVVAIRGVLPPLPWLPTMDLWRTERNGWTFLFPARLRWRSYTFTPAKITSLWDLMSASLPTSTRTTDGEGVAGGLHIRPRRARPFGYDVAS